MGIQKQINQDYKYLAKDYGMLGSELLKRPVTRYILGGVALMTLAPFVMRFFRREEVQTFFRDNVQGIRSRIDDVIHSRDMEMDTMNH